MTAATTTLPIAGRNTLLASLRVIAFLAWTLPGAFVCVLLKVTGFNSAPMRQRVYRGICKIFGIELVVHGTPVSARPLLIASNHISYLDILAYGAVAELEFVSKAEVATWPLIGTLAKLSDTVFIDRRRSQTHAAKKDMADRLAHETHAGLMVFFPESTSGDGNRMLPFKSALFSVAESLSDTGAIAVQPAAIAYTRLNGLPTGRGWRAFTSWYGEMPFSSHAWRFLQLGRITVEISFLPALDAAQTENRKAMAQACERSVRDGFNGLLTGQQIV